MLLHTFGNDCYSSILPGLWTKFIRYYISEISSKFEVSGQKSDRLLGLNGQFSEIIFISEYQNNVSGIEILNFFLSNFPGTGQNRGCSCDESLFSD